MKINEPHIIKKSLLKNLIEEFIYEKLEKEEYAVITIRAEKLLTWNRFDLAFKLFYLENKVKNKEMAIGTYWEDIKSQTLGVFAEYGNESKNNFKKYVDLFDEIYTSIKEEGFNKDKTLIPLSNQLTINNGAHRVSSAIFLKKSIECIVTESDPFICNYKYFYDRNVPLEILELMTTTFIKYSSNVYLAFLWPSGEDNYEKSKSLFTNIVYEKEITLTPRGGLNLITQLYEHMEWVGSRETGFKGAKQKLIECFPTFNSFWVIAFQAENLNEVRKIKEEVRLINNIGYSSIHITDTIEETLKISELIFNVNGIHFLNYANPYKYLFIYKKMDLLSDYLQQEGISKNDIVIDGSLLLALYGIRSSEDIDLLMYDNINTIKYGDIEFEMHDSELKYHKQTKEAMIYNPQFYFVYNGYKFISFKQLYQMKRNRDTEKDINDCNLMKFCLEGNSYKMMIARMAQYLYYFKIKLVRRIRNTLMFILRVSGLYKPVRWLYRKIRNKDE